MEILPKELAIVGAVYIHIIFKETNYHRSFYVPEDCHHDILYELLRPELFLYRWHNVFLHYGQSFWLGLKHFGVKYVSLYTWLINL